MRIKYFGSSSFILETEKSIFGLDYLPQKAEENKRKFFIASRVFYNKNFETKNEFFSIRFPGEYEIDNFRINCFGINDREDIYNVVEIRDEILEIVYLGKLKNLKFEANIIEALEDADVLIIPVEPKEPYYNGAKKLIQEIEPKLIIPYSLDSQNEVIQKFIRELGFSLINLQELRITPKKEFPAKAIILEAQNLKAKIQNE